jgi:hypothetical protein
MTKYIDVSTTGQCTRGQMERQKRELYLSLSYLNVTSRLTTTEIEILVTLKDDPTIIEMIRNL